MTSKHSPSKSGNSSSGCTTTEETSKSETVVLPYRTDPELSKPIEFLDLFANATIEGDLLQRLDECHGDLEKLKNEMRDPNVMVLWKALDIARDTGGYIVSDDPIDEKYTNAFINFLKINIVLFKQVPWWRSRMGWFMWFCACASNPDAYYPMVMEDHFGPKHWYHAGEVPRVGPRQGGEGNPAFLLD